MAEVGLRQELRGWQILLITMSGVIGVTIFSNGGQALEIAGPGGMLCAYCIVGLIAIAVMEGVSEMVQLFPAPNAIVEYVKAFVDADLAWVVGVAYWYTYSAIFATQIIAAAGFSSYWNFPQSWQTIVFYILSPIVILVINFAGVKWYGYVEAFGGSLKLCMVLGCGVFLYVTADQENFGSKYFEAGLQNNPRYASNHSQAVAYAIFIISYGFLAIEIVAMTAYEARDMKDLRRPSQLVAYIICFSYLFCALGEALDVEWNDPDLPVIYGASNVNGAATVKIKARSRAVVVIAAERAGYKHAPGFLTGCMIFSAMSAANTSLHLGTVVPRTGVPGWALLVSAIAFFWLPFLQLKSGYAAQELVEIMAVSGSVSGLIVWASLCLAFIRYEYWLRMHKDSLHGAHYGRYNRWDRTVRESSTFLGYFQPVVAWAGLAGCLLVVFVFSSAMWWNGVIRFRKVASAYASPIILLALWIIRKIVFGGKHEHQRASNSQSWVLKLTHHINGFLGSSGVLEGGSPRLSSPKDVVLINGDRLAATTVKTGHLSQML
ncbi:hypothetical protein EPUS_07229 [Endocarpon pusillum Z07020]|uniref:Amino acid permease/ SLC12A domain-containing protein n=1 Tax=Endocarpon pusillum (strain Z07020 / HMAS-L-300199) TaxID=1263415 RepID=U1FVA1_ENDPU|nr:uncharacterized protein EPUS_07229 [Endocarpon pusillum Z07020]ERF68742.1 hypothetical protein EPUS_07229 [Endocarpon pusillum Z07020]